MLQLLLFISSETLWVLGEACDGGHALPLLGMSGTSPDNLDSAVEPAIRD